MNTIIINGNAEDVLSTKLSEILDCFDISDNFMCQLTLLEAVNKDENFDQLEFEEKVRNANHGIIFSFEEMKQIEKNLHQIFELYMNVLDNKCHADSKDEICKIAEISLVDGSYYLVVVQDNIVLENLLKLDGAFIE